MPDMERGGFVAIPDMLARVAAVYDAAKAVTGVDIPRVITLQPREDKFLTEGIPGAPADRLGSQRDRDLIRMVRALAAIIAWGPFGYRAISKSMMQESAACLGAITMSALYREVRLMEDLLRTRPEGRRVIEGILEILEDQEIPISLPEPWRDALGFAWLRAACMSKGREAKWSLGPERFR